MDRLVSDSPDEEIGPGVMTFNKPEVVRASDNFIVDSQFNEEVGHGHNDCRGACPPVVYQYRPGSCRCAVQNCRKTFLLQQKIPLISLIFFGDWWLVRPDKPERT